MPQSKLTAYWPDEARPKRYTPNSVFPFPKYVACLSVCDSAHASWRSRGYEVLRTRERVEEHAGNIAFAMALSPCVDLCQAGARWWKKKRAIDPQFQEKAIAELVDIERVLQAARSPYCLLCPASHLVRRHFRSPDFVVHPCDFGGYLPENSRHPKFPDLMPPRDAYRKKTFVFGGNGFILPRRRPVDAVTIKIKKKSKTVDVSPVYAKRKNQCLRKLPPLGFCEAVARLHAQEESDR